MKTRMNLTFFLLAGFVSVSSNCSKNKTGGTGDTSAVTAEYWITKADQTATLQKQTTQFNFGTTANNNSVIDIDSTKNLSDRGWIWLCPYRWQCLPDQSYG